MQLLHKIYNFLHDLSDFRSFNFSNTCFYLPARKLQIFFQRNSYFEEFNGLCVLNGLFMVKSCRISFYKQAPSISLSFKTYKAYFLEYEKLCFVKKSSEQANFARDSRGRSEQLFSGTGPLSTLPVQQLLSPQLIINRPQVFAVASF